MGTFLQIDPAGSNGRAYYAPAQGGTGPGVLLGHAWWGLTPFFTGLADRLAAFIAHWNVRAHPFNWSTKSVAKVMSACPADAIAGGKAAA